MDGTQELKAMLDDMAKPMTRLVACETHGDFESRRVFGAVWSKCPACSAEAEIEDKRRREAMEADRKRRAWEQKIGAACIPERFRDRTLSSYSATTDGQKRALAFAKQYADRFDDVLKTGRGALFLGKPGTGKTHLAIGIALHVMRQNGASALFFTVMRAIRTVKDTWRKGSDTTETGAINALVFPDLLVLDEVGVQFGSDAEKLLLFDVLNERYEQRRPTLLLSNLTTPEVAAYLGERVMDRLREDGGQIVPFDWNSHRGTA